MGQILQYFNLAMAIILEFFWNFPNSVWNIPKRVWSFPGGVWRLDSPGLVDDHLADAEGG